MTEIVYSGKFYFEGSFQDLYVTTGDGIITKVEKFQNMKPSIKIEGPILPGFTDTHVHFRDPGETEKEDFFTGSMSAAFGGTTTVLDMPNNIIPVKDYEQFDRKKGAIRRRSFVDYGLYSLYDGTNRDIISRESVGVKIFMGESTNSSTYSGDYNSDSYLQEYERPVVFHGEALECLKKHENGSINTLHDHNMSRPSQCEREAFETIASLKTKNKIAAHVSDINNLNGLEGKFNGEVTPHHILLHDGMHLGAYGKVNPPLRERNIMDETRQGFLDGKFQLLSSDHAPHTERDKENVQFGKSGIIGVETRIPLMLALVQKKILPLQTLISVGAEKPSEIFNLNKGKIEKGYFADFVSIRFSDMTRLNEERLHSKLPISPFNGFDVLFPRDVFIRGECVISSGEIIEECNGNFIFPTKDQNVS